MLTYLPFLGPSFQMKSAWYGLHGGVLSVTNIQLCCQKHLVLPCRDLNTPLTPVCWPKLLLQMRLAIAAFIAHWPLQCIETLYTVALS